MFFKDTAEGEIREIDCRVDLYQHIVLITSRLS